MRRLRLLAMVLLVLCAGRLRADAPAEVTFPNELPRSWVLRDIARVAPPFAFGKVHVLAWSSVEDHRPLRVDSCLVLKEAETDQVDRWWLSHIYRHPLEKDNAWKLPPPWVAPPYPLGPKKAFGITYTKRFKNKPGNKDIYDSLKGIKWSFLLSPDWNLVGCAVCEETWLAAIGEKPTRYFRTVAEEKPATKEAPQARGFFPHVKRILFLGDSITYDGRYLSYFETQWRLHLRERPIEIISCGLPSETVSGLSEDGHAGGKFPRPDVHERLGRVLKKTRPDLVFACYGMNDGIYLPLNEARFAKFKAGMTKLHEKVESAGARIVHLTPPVFDPLPIKNRTAPADKVTADRPYEKYDDVLEQYAGWLLQMRKQGWQVIDFHGAMKSALLTKRRDRSDFTFAPDGVHPNEAGQILLGKALIEGVRAPFAGVPSKLGDPATAGSPAAKVFQLVHERCRLLTEAWLTDIGHKRPMPAGLPLEKANARAADIDRRIGQLLR